MDTHRRMPVAMDIRQSSLVETHIKRQEENVVLWIADANFPLVFLTFSLHSFYCSPYLRLFSAFEVSFFAKRNVCYVRKFSDSHGTMMFNHKVHSCSSMCKYEWINTEARMFLKLIKIIPEKACADQWESIRAIRAFWHEFLYGFIQYQKWKKTFPTRIVLLIES